MCTVGNLKCKRVEKFVIQVYVLLAVGKIIEFEIAMWSWRSISKSAYM